MRVGILAPWLSSRVSGGDRYVYALASALLSEHEVDLISLFPVDVHAVAAPLGFELGRAGVRALHPGRGPLFRWLDRRPGRHLYRDLYIAGDAMRASRGYDVFFAQHFMSLAPARGRRNVLICQFPHFRFNWRYFVNRPRYWAYALLRYGFMRPELGSYQEVLCYSSYVRTWIERRWGVGATVLYPPVEVPPTPPAAKDRVILSVARFFAKGYNKGHPALVEAFRRLVEDGLQGWELHLAGSRHYDDPVDVDYYDRLVDSAAGLPVVFHPDAGQDQVEALYRRAAVFWHPTGFGMDLGANPEWAEHFGISTVEAMGHGAVPVVLAAGGQAEIVRHGVDGYTWLELDQLVGLTRRVTGDGRARRRLAAAARQRALDFAPARFEADVAQLMRRLTS